MNPEDGSQGIWSSVSDAELLTQLSNAKAAVQDFQAILGRLEMEIYRRCDERGTVGIVADGRQADVRRTWTYDQERLTPLLEALDAARLKEVYSPPYEETITHAARWNTQKVIALGRRDEKVREIVEGAKRPGGRSIALKEEA